MARSPARIQLSAEEESTLRVWTGKGTGKPVADALGVATFRIADNPPGAPVFGVRTSYSLTTDPGRIVFAIPQIPTTTTSRPEALTSRSMSSGSLVRIVAFCRRAVVTTTASTTSGVLVMPNSRPAS